MIALFHVCDSECGGADVSMPKKWQIGKYYFDRCPKRECNVNVLEYIRLYQCFKNGILANKGGYFDQSNKYIESMTFIETEINKHKADNVKQN
jgi:hypothetical protein